MECYLEFTMPCEEPGFVEYKRAFVVQGRIISDKKIPDDASLTINLINRNNDIVRYISCDKKNKSIFSYCPDLTTYEESLDPGRIKMQEFGFPELIVADLDKPEASIHNATIKLWYSDNEFKGIFVSASDIEHGAIFDDGLNLVDENNKPYSTLPCGNYTLEATLSFANFKTSSIKRIKIGKRKEQLICRFNPQSHKSSMLDWCGQNKISIIKDLLPGYLDAYLGKWFYHMGLLKMYRANDICLYDSAKLVMFVYLIDETSTSYATELAYLQAKGELAKNRISYYHYDIGEAIIGKGKDYEKTAKIIKFEQDEYMYLCRIDIVNDKARESIYYLDERGTESVITDFNDVSIKAGEKLAVMGVIKPWQLDRDDFILKDDNTYLVQNYPDTIRYLFIIDGEESVMNRKANMERIDEYSIGTSVYEFYNIIHIEDGWSNKDIDVEVECLDAKGNISPTKAHFKIHVE